MQPGPCKLMCIHQDLGEQTLMFSSISVPFSRACAGMLHDSFLQV